jgi:hypothetical protein
MKFQIQRSYLIFVVAIGLHTSTFAQGVPSSEKAKTGVEVFLTRLERHLACHDIYDSIYLEGERLVSELFEYPNSIDLLKNDEIRSLEIFRNRLKERTTPKVLTSQTGLQTADVELSEQAFKIYTLFSSDLLTQLKSLQPTNKAELKTAFAKIFESESTPGDMAERLSLGISHLQKRAVDLGFTCADLTSLHQMNAEIKASFENEYQRFQLPTPKDASSTMPPESQSALLDRIVRGAHNAFANLYQRCDVLSSAAVNGSLLIPGIVITGSHPAGGKRRNITRKGGVPIPEFFAKHPYLKDYDAFYNEKGEALGCSKLHQNPPIYDFGGKANSTNGLMDHFSNSGSGTSVLGVDCSGFIVSAMISSGSRLKKNVALNPASLLSNTGASSLRSPQSNNLTCLSTYNIQKTNKTILTLQAGDILASTGHVVIVEWMGPDPFGISKLSSAQDCTSSKFDSKNFKIRILHSSPENNGIGIARHDLANFTNATYASAFEELAIKTCKATFQSGFVGVSTTASGVNAVRFTAASGCTESGKEFTRSNCVSQCHYKF